MDVLIPLSLLIFLGLSISPFLCIFGTVLIGWFKLRATNIRKLRSFLVLFISCTMGTFTGVFLKFIFSWSDNSIFELIVLFWSFFFTSLSILYNISKGKVYNSTLEIKFFLTPISTAAGVLVAILTFVLFNDTFISPMNNAIRASVPTIGSFSSMAIGLANWNLNLFILGPHMIFLLLVSGVLASIAGSISTGVMTEKLNQGFGRHINNDYQIASDIVKYYLKKDPNVEYIGTDEIEKYLGKKNKEILRKSDFDPWLYELTEIVNQKLKGSKLTDREIDDFLFTEGVKHFQDIKKWNPGVSTNFIMSAAERDQFHDEMVKIAKTIGIKMSQEYSHQIFKRIKQEYCDRCGQKLQPNALYCTKCGKRSNKLKK